MVQKELQFKPLRVSVGMFKLTTERRPVKSDRWVKVPTVVTMVKLLHIIHCRTYSIGGMGKKDTRMTEMKQVNSEFTWYKLTNEQAISTYSLFTCWYQSSGSAATKLESIHGTLECVIPKIVKIASLNTQKSVLGFNFQRFLTSLIFV